MVGLTWLDAASRFILAARIPIGIHRQVRFALRASMHAALQWHGSRSDGNVYQRAQKTLI
jgi:hypothetical protein